MHRSIESDFRADAEDDGSKKPYRTLFLSDFHLGTRGCQADFILEFLKHYDADTIYLVGDIVDGWRLSRSWYWPQSHNDVVQKLLEKGREGAKIIYTPGNHDEMLRDYCGHNFGAVELRDRDIFETVSGKKYLVIHGDQFDVVVRHARWLALLGDWAYRTVLVANRWLNVVRRRLGFQYWSLSAWAKHKVKNAVNFIGAFENALVTEAQHEKVDGVICGHVHHAADAHFGDVHYLNCGDWVESNSAIVEHHDGTLEVIRFTRFASKDKPKSGQPLEDVSAGQKVDRPVAA